MASTNMADRVEALHGAYRALRSLATIRRSEGYKWHQIATEAGLSRRTLRRYLHRARKIGR